MDFEVASPRGGGARVLIVDDDEALCRVIAKSMSRAGYYVVIANDAETATARSTELPPDVAIVDLEMPGLGGLAIAGTLKRQHGAAVHVMVLTGHADEARRRDAFAAGADDYVVKPVSLSEITRRVAVAARTQQEFVQVRLDKEATERRLVYGQEATALLAHDLNNGLAVTLSNLSMATEDLPDSEAKLAVVDALRAMRRMSGLVANFVDIARFEDAAVKPAVATVRVISLLESVTATDAPFGTKNATFAISCARDLEARFDAGLVERVLHNLVGNATRYCNRGGTITVGASAWHDVGGVELWVQNTGAHVPEHLRANLFGKYVHGNNGKRGMGLYFSRLVAEAHGGSTLYQARDAGPTCVVQLPGRG